MFYNWEGIAVKYFLTSSAAQHREQEEEINIPNQAMEKCTSIRKLFRDEVCGR